MHELELELELGLELGLERQLAVEQKLVLAPAPKLAQPGRLVVALEMGLVRVPVVQGGRRDQPQW